MTTVSIANISATHDTRVSLASRVSISSNSTAVKYQFWSSNAAYGHVVVGGVEQDYCVAIDLSISDFATASVDVGDALAPVTDYIRVFDGTAWSAWTSFTVVATANTPPTVTYNLNQPAGVIGAHTPFSSIFSFNDADGDTIKGVYVWVGDGTTNHGHVYLNGQDLAHNTAIYLTMDQFNHTDYDNTLDGTTILWAKPSDGYSTPPTWGMGVTMPAATAVSPTAHPATVSYGGGTLAAGVGTDTIGANVIASYFDADSDPAVLYLLWDDGVNSGANGHMLYDGAVLGVGQNMEFTPSQMADVTYQATGATGTSDSIWARAWDGTQWGPWTHIVETAGTEHDPTVSASGTSTDVAIGSSTAVSSLFDASDADTAISAYKFWDGDAGVNSGHLTVGGIAQHANGWVQVDAANLSSVDWTGAATAGYGENLYVQAVDPMGHTAMNSLILAMNSH